MAPLEPHLGRDMQGGRQRFPMLPDGAFRFALAIYGRGIDPIDPGFYCPLEHIVARYFIRIDEDAASDPAAEGKLGNLQARAAEHSLAHRACRPEDQRDRNSDRSLKR